MLPRVFFQNQIKKSFAVAKKSGFKQLNKPKTGYYNFADIDDIIISIHHYLRLLIDLLNLQ